MSIKKIQILGPFNSGTNLLVKILKSNIKQNIEIEKEGHTLFWKHTIYKKRIVNYIESNKDTLFICLYKPLYNWIRSIKKCKYSIEWTKEIKDKCKFMGKTYINIIEIYNAYYKMYIELINTYKRVIFINYYDIIDKKNIINYISNKLSKYNLCIKSNNNILSILNKPAKKHGSSVKSSEEANKIKNTCYDEINKCIDDKLIIMKHFNNEIKKFFEN